MGKTEKNWPLALKNRPKTPKKGGFEAKNRYDAGQKKTKVSKSGAAFGKQTAFMRYAYQKTGIWRGSSRV